MTAAGKAALRGFSTVLGWFMTTRVAWWIASWLALALCGCSLHQSEVHEMPPGSAGSGADHGYALLFDLVGDEKDVSKLLIIKRERSELKELVKSISDTAGRAHKQLEAFAKDDTAVNLKDRGLPAPEEQTRAAIAKTRSKELLAEGGKDFEVQLLLTQNEALTYGAHLAQTLARTERDVQRSRYFTDLGDQLAQLQRKVAGMLLENYTWKGK